MPFPEIDPIAFSLGPFAVRWYALGYIAGVFGGALYATTLLKRARLWADNKPPFPSGAIWDFAFWAMIAIVVGGRAGYVLFYDLSTYAANPAEIIALWDGGMSFHGGLAGIMIAMAWFVRRHGGNILSGFDLLGSIATIGIFLVRITNFINGELYGKPSGDLEWGVVFPTAQDGISRHPTQLYEAGLEGLATFVIVALATWFLGSLKRPGLAAGIFALCYSAGRLFVEVFRLPDEQLGYLFGTDWITMGMLLTLPLALTGVALVVNAMARPRD